MSSGEEAVEKHADRMRDAHGMNANTCRGSEEEDKVSSRVR